MPTFAVQTLAVVFVFLQSVACLEMLGEMILPPEEVTLVSKINDSVAKISGDAILGGLFSIHRSGNSGEDCTVWTNPMNIKRMEAMLFAVDEINNDSNILPGIRLGAEIRDDCFSGTVALEESLNFVVNAFGQSENFCSAEDENSPVFGVVGTGASETSLAVASLLRLFRLPQVSYAATSPDLSNRDDYKYFTRTVPSDKRQVEAILDIIHELNWTAVFLISSPGNYGERIREEFVERAQDKKICIVDRMEVGARKNGETEVNDTVDSFLRKINATTTVRGLVLLTHHFDTITVLQGVMRTGIARDRFRWLASDTWGSGQDLEGVEEIADGAITIALHTPNETAILKKFRRYFNALKPGNNSRNPWFDDFWEYYFKCALSVNIVRNATQCTGNELLESGFGNVKDDKLPHVLDAVYALAYSFHRMVRGTNSSGNWSEISKRLAKSNDTLLDYLLLSNFSGVSGMVRFDRNGNGMPRYDIMSYTNRTYQKIAVWNRRKFLTRGLTGFRELKARDQASGSYCAEVCSMGEERVHLSEDLSCCSKCRRCLESQYVDTELLLCMSCPQREQTNQNRTGCEKVPEGHPAQYVVVVLAVWASLGLVATAFVTFTMYKFYSTPLVMASGRELMLVVLAGIMMCYCLGFALLASPNARRCIYQRFGSGVFLAVCYSAILVKNNRIARIFRGRHRPAFITPAPQLLITALLVSIQVAISLVATYFGTTLEVTEYYDDGKVYTICRTSGTEYVISISYNVLLLLLCTCYAFLTRKLPANFNEARRVGITMYAMCAQWICFLPLFYGTVAVYQTAVLLLSSCFNATVLLVGMFGHKVYVVWFRPEKNSRQASNPRGRVGSSTSVSGKSVHMTEGINGDGTDNGWCYAMRRFSSKTTLESTIGTIS